ncbi:MAG: 3-oxoacid CoA-transferase subunit B [Phreatobacter sp.]|jgi:3-oxoadipate CoA-transferase beta subunit|uniref:3-oxoacid CoA-transferase subunit B n=1 Tax=Phreatobacter sp. TaxID=1966341 RepID=UPI0040352528
MTDTVARLTRRQMAWRAAQDIADGSYVNLGIGIPELCADFVPQGRRVTYHTENGILGFGEAPAKGLVDFDLINAGKKPVSLLPGAAIFDHATSFSMIRGKHIDLAILGAFQVSAQGDLANWSTGDNSVPAVGGAMDLVVGARDIYIITEHTTRTGEPKLLDACSYPLTGIGVVRRVFTDLAVIDVTSEGFVVSEIVAGMSLDELQAKTGSPLAPHRDLRSLHAPAL